MAAQRDYIRVSKEAVHELGHLLGLGHCPDAGASCTSQTEYSYCQRCEAKA